MTPRSTLSGVSRAIHLGRAQAAGGADGSLSNSKPAAPVEDRGVPTNRKFPVSRRQGVVRLAFGHQHPHPRRLAANAVGRGTDRCGPVRLRRWPLRGSRSTSRVSQGLRAGRTAWPRNLLRQVKRRGCRSDVSDTTAFWNATHRKSWGNWHNAAESLQLVALRRCGEPSDGRRSSPRRGYFVAPPSKS